MQCACTDTDNVEFNHLTLYLLLDSSFWFDTITLGWSIVYIKGSHIGLDEQKFLRKIVNIFLPISFNMFWVLKRTVSLRGFFEYPQHMFWLRNKKINF